MNHYSRRQVARRGGAITAVTVAAVFLPGVTGLGAAAPSRPSTSLTLPHVTHVWNIVLENETYSGTFGNPSADPYLAQTLPSEGVLLEDYYGIGHHSADNYIALASGQPPNASTQNDCSTFATFPNTSSDVNGLETGNGCVYPKAITTIGNQLTSKKLSWKGYMEDMGNIPSREAAACGHPALNTTDNTEQAVQGDGYATRHDPFVYFESTISNKTFCNAHVVAMGSSTGVMPSSALPGETGLEMDLQSASTTPAYSFITPNLCNDGHDFPCKNQSNGASALADIDNFLSTWVPMIMNSPAYRSGGGLIEVTFDESDGTSDSSACCNEQAGPTGVAPGISGPGGGLVGAVLISPFIKAGSVSTVPYNHYSTLGTDEKLFGLKSLGDAKTVSATFGADVFNNA